MLNFCSLYSGSSGNSLLVETENTKLLVDAGVSSRKIENALNDINIDPSSIDAILITHEHSDHVQGLGTFSKKFDFFRKALIQNFLLLFDIIFYFAIS